jgi:hypothetical protein
MALPFGVASVQIKAHATQLMEGLSLLQSWQLQGAVSLTENSDGGCFLEERAGCRMQRRVIYLSRSIPVTTDHTRDAGTSAKPKKKFTGPAEGHNEYPHLRKSMSVIQKDRQMVLLNTMPLTRLPHLFTSFLMP